MFNKNGKILSMEKLTIKSVQKFCELRQKLQGQHTLPAQEWSFSGRSVDVRFRQLPLTIDFTFEGGQDHDGYYLSGSWRTCVPAICSRCGHDLDIDLDTHYPKIYLKEEESNLLDSNLDILECRMVNANFVPWMLSEVILQVPISPKHAQCVLEQKQEKIEKGKNKIIVQSQNFFEKLSNFNNQD